MPILKCIKTLGGIFKSRIAKEKFAFIWEKKIEPGKLTLFFDFICFLSVKTIISHPDKHKTRGV